jgi:hypothetical protein
LKTGLKYEYLDDIESNIFFPFPISNHDVIKHIKISQNIFFKIIILQMLKRALKIIIIFGILKSP